jgi:NADPH:quinone reductase-like Zn-dependent oxidoreductase
VELVGAGAADCHGTPLAAGDAVVGTSPGSVAERVVVDGARLAPRLSAVPAEVAGGLPGPALTASSCLISVPVGPGDTLLVSGASGAVGMLVSQLAVAAGARVIGTAAERNFDLVRGLGAQPVAYGPGLPERVAELGTVTAVIDCHGRDGLDLGHALGLPSERMIGIAAGPAEQELGLRRVDFAGRTPQRLAELLQLVADGKLRLPVAQTFPIQDVVAAFTALESQHAPGKIVVLP